jgi:UDP-galactopyranose mutase
MFIEGYTVKQWGKRPKDLPASIIKRIPVRFDYNDNYFDDLYQALPHHSNWTPWGYSDLMLRMIDNPLITVRLEVDAKGFLKNNPNIARKKIMYTGAVDEFYDYEFGQLEYRSLLFEEVATTQSTGAAVLNYTDEHVPYTRVTDHKYFLHSTKDLPLSILTHEYPQKYVPGVNEPLYPINDAKNNLLHKKYLAKAKSRNPNVCFRGRLGTYRYLNMDAVVCMALNDAEEELKSVVSEAIIIA